MPERQERRAAVLVASYQWREWRCQRRERWCRRYERKNHLAHGTIYVEPVGTIYSCAQCGNMGRFRQELRVGAFLAASLTGPPECPFLPPVFPN